MTDKRENDRIVKETVIENLVYYDAAVSEARVRMFAAELADLDPVAVRRAFAEFRRERGRRQMPMPADVRARIAPADVSHRALATEAAARVLTAISSYGPWQVDRARSYVGELGWAVVTAQGGWSEVCRTTGEDTPVGVAQAQWTRLAEALLETGRALVREEVEGPRRGLECGVTGVGELLKRMPGTEGE